MKARSTHIYFTTFCLALLGLGCSPTVEDVCEDVVEDCPDVDGDECLSDGNRLESFAQTRGCEDAFEAYLECVSDSVCSWRNTCQSERSALETCVGAFP